MKIGARASGWSLVALSGLLYGCADPCEQAIRTLCEKSCECTGTGECKFGDESSAITFEDENDCVGFFTLFGACEEETAIDYEACNDALESAACIELLDGDQGLEVPEVCSE